MGSGGEGHFVRLRTWLLDRPRYHKRALLVFVDLFLLSLLLWVGLSIRYGTLFVPESWLSALLLISGPLITVGTLWHLGIYRLVTRFIGRRGIAQVLIGMALAVLIWSLIVFMVGQFGVPRTVITAYGAVGAAVILAVRGVIKLLLDSAGIHFRAASDSGIRKATIIYGADSVGMALLQAVQKARDRYIVGFVDTSPTLWRQYVGGLKVYPPQRLPRLIEREKVQEILVAMPSANRRERKRILQELEQLPVTVKILPTYEDISSGNVSLMSLRDVEVSDLLGRDPVAPNIQLMNRNTVGKSVLVTGAAGSIGSELVRQIARRSPRRLVLLDTSERGLYQTEYETRTFLNRDPDSIRPELTVVLGSVTDRGLLDQVISDYEIDTIYHAAAYKHVPLVEQNPLAGIDNNAFGTLVAARCARRHGVERFVLVSTDKAVRPTNVMGASKRLAELILQAEAVESTNTVFTMVRFGNVLDSSGSVVPLFRNQIRAGGPITVTHPDVTRYFMSIPEAAELVIQAGAMATGGEVFILHMGDPVKIDDLARLMVRLSNLEVRDVGNPYGDIEIVYTGLRPGEKLYEELLIGANAQTTEHPRIFKSDEPFLSPGVLAPALDQLQSAMSDRNLAGVIAILKRTVVDYRPGSEPGQNKPSSGEAWGTEISQTLH